MAFADEGHEIAFKELLKVFPNASYTQLSDTIQQKCIIYFYARLE